MINVQYPCDNHKIKMDASLMLPSLYTIKGIVLLDNDGKRLWANYYDPGIFPSTKEQLRFEKCLFGKSNKANFEEVDVVMLDNLTILYKSKVDLYFYVIGGPKENELLLMSVLNCVFESMSLILRKNVEKSNVYENMDMIMLAMDEICDNGIILECDALVVADRVGIKAEDVSIGKQTAAQVFQSAKDQFEKWNIYKESSSKQIK